MAAFLLSGTTFNMYTAPVGTAATAVTPASGAIAPTSPWAAYGANRPDNGVTLEMPDEVAELMFQGSKGLVDEYRVIKQGLMINIPLFDMTHESINAAWGGGITETASAPSQVGVRRLNLNRPLVIPSHGVEFVLQSAYDDDGDEGWLGLIHLPQARIVVTTLDTSIEPAPMAVQVMQMNHTTPAFWDSVFADAQP